MPIAKAGRSAGQRTLLLSLLLAAYTLNFIDRTIIGVVGQAIKEDFALSDTQLGLLSGLSFALLYTLLGLPAARLSERVDRSRVIAGALLIWSGFTIACGMAQNFTQLLLVRVGVGVGEAGCTPPAHALIADHFPAEKRATALAVYSLGVPIGTALGAACGGWLTDRFDWRTAMMIVGTPGIVLAIVIRFVVSDVRAQADTRLSLTYELTASWNAAKRLLRQPTTGHVTVGMTLCSTATYGIGAFTAPYFIRAFGLSYTQAGLMLGLTMGISAGAGTLVGGVLSDRLSHRSPAWRALLPAIGLLLAAPIYMLAYVQDDWRWAAGLLLIPGIFAYLVVAPSYAVVQAAALPGERATLAAIFLMIVNLVALGGGPLLTGWLIDWFYGASATTGPGATAQMATASRWGIIMTLGFHVWGALHYLAAARGMTRESLSVAQKC